MGLSVQGEEEGGWMSLRIRIGGCCFCRRRCKERGGVRMRGWGDSLSEYARNRVGR